MSDSKSPRCIILGGGGHARVLIDCLQLMGTVELLGVLERDTSQQNTNVLGVPILGNDQLLERLVREGEVTHFIIGLGSAHDTRPRRKLYQYALDMGIQPLEVRHPTAICSKWAEIGVGCQLLPGAIVNAGVRLGANVIINSGAIVEHDCLIGDHVHIATGAKLAAAIQVGVGAHIGAGAVIRQGLSIGEAAVVGIGAVVVKDVPPNIVVAGVPARYLRSI